MFARTEAASGMKIAIVSCPLERGPRRLMQSSFPQRRTTKRIPRVTSPSHHEREGDYSQARATIVVLTYNRLTQVQQTLHALVRLPGGWPIIVVDNGSRDETAATIKRNFPQITVLRSPLNLGAAGRNLAMAQLNTPYVAFCDDDTQWEFGALERAVQILDASERVGILSARVEMGASRRPDPTCLEMAHSPLPREDLPGPQLLGFMAGACVMRATAFRATGGYWPPFFIGGEEELMAYDVIGHGWRIIYADEVVTRHFPSGIRDTHLRQRLLLRNAVWVVWMRRPWRAVGRETWRLLRQARAAQILRPVLASTLLGLPRALSRRKAISPALEQMRRLLDK